MSEMKIKAIAPWFGGKRTLAPRIVEELGPHKCYWEPFCGSMAVLMAKPPVTMETVNDLHEDLINLARVIRDPDLGAKLYRRLRRTLMHEDIFKEAAEIINSGRAKMEMSFLERAYNFFIVSWLGRNGVIGTAKYNNQYCKRYTTNGGHGAKRWSGVIKSIPAWRRRMANVTMLNTDGFEVLERIYDETGTAIYVDPPYLTKGAKYIHDFEDDDHVRLSKLLHRFKRARVVISYYDDPRLTDLYPPGKWTKVHCPITKCLVNIGMRNKTGKAKIAPEILLINGPSYTQQKGLFREGNP